MAEYEKKEERYLKSMVVILSEEARAIMTFGTVLVPIRM